MVRISQNERLNAESSHQAWLRSLTALVQSGEYAEALALASFFPRTPSRLVIECAAALGTNQYRVAEAMLRASGRAPDAIATDFVPLLPALNASGWLGLAQEARTAKAFSLAHLGLEAYLLEHPQTSLEVKGLLSELVEGALGARDMDAVLAMLRHVPGVEDRPDALIAYTKKAVMARMEQQESRLVAAVRELAREALARIAPTDVSRHLRIAVILVVDDQLFEEALREFRLCLEISPDERKRISHILFHLLVYKPYYRDLALFLIEIDGCNVLETTRAIVERYYKMGSAECATTLSLILNARDFVGEGLGSEFASALLQAADIVDNLETFVELVLPLELPWSQALGLAEALVKRETNNPELVARLATKAMPADAVVTRERLSAVYAHLSALARRRSDKSAARQHLARAVPLATGLAELLENAGPTPVEQCLVLVENYQLLSGARYFDPLLVSVVDPIIGKLTAEDRRRLLLALVSDEFDLPIPNLLSLLERIFDADLELTDQDVERLYHLAASLGRPELRNALERGLAVQRPPERENLLNRIRQVEQNIKEKIALGEPRKQIHNFVANSFSDFEIMSESSPNLVTRSILRRTVMEQRIRIVPRFYNLDETHAVREEMLSYMHRRLSGDVALKTMRMRDMEIPERMRAPREPVRGRATWERHTRVRFPAKCTLYRPIELGVQLTESEPSSTRSLMRIMLNVDAHIPSITLDVQVTGSAFAIRERHAQICVPAQGDSNEVVFLLFPAELGKQAVEVEFFHRSERVGYVIVDTEVKDHLQDISTTHMVSMEDPVDYMQKGLKISRSNRRIVHVTYTEREGKIAYTIYSEDRSEFGEWEINKADVCSQVEDMLRELNAGLMDTVSRGVVDDDVWESLRLNLESTGATLFETLVPKEIAALSVRWDDRSKLIVSTNEQWIPWELMHDDRGFWGSRFILARYPRLSDRRQMPAEHRLSRSAPCTIRRIINVVGGGISREEATRAAGLFSWLAGSAAVESLISKPLAALGRMLSNVEVLHFTCHGYLEPHMLQIAEKKTRGENLLLTSVRGLNLGSGCLVFANACTSSMPVLTFGRFNSFGWEFYRRGADVFIGAIGAIPTKYALPFAEHVYRSLLGKTPVITVGEALAEAKQVASQEKNLFWLLYTVFGDPDSRYETQ